MGAILWLVTFLFFLESRSKSDYHLGGSDTLDFDGTTAYCEALDLDPGDPVMLALAHMLEAPTMGHFAKKQWIQGWRSVKCGDLLSSPLSCTFLTKSITKQVGHD